MMDLLRWHAPVLALLIAAVLLVERMV